MYAIVKAGGRQEKVAVGDTLLMDRVAAATGATITLQALLLVDGAKVTTDTAGINVSVEVLETELMSCRTKMCEQCKCIWMTDFLSLKGGHGR